MGKCAMSFCPFSSTSRCPAKALTEGLGSSLGPRGVRASDGRSSEALGRPQRTRDLCAA